MKKNVADLSKMPEIVMAFYSKKDYNDLLCFILTEMMDLTDADGGTLYVIEEGKLHFRIMKTASMNYFRGPTDRIDLPPISLDEKNISNISAYAAIKNELVNIDDVYGNTEFNFSGPKNYDAMTGYHTHSMLVFPLTSSSGEEEEVIGVIQLINSIDGETGQVKPFDYSEYEMQFLRALSNISANALSNLQQAKEIKELFNSFVRVMTKAIDERSRYNVNHTNNVARYCGDFAIYLSNIFPYGHELHFDENRREKLIMAALLHDIGKIVTPLEIMDKPSRLHNRIYVIQYKFQIKKLQLEIAYLTDKISVQQYEAELEALDEALGLIEQTNPSGYLEDDKAESIEELSHITYENKKGVTAPILTEYDMDSLTVKNGTLTENERKIMQEHVSVTERLLAEMSFNKFYRKVPEWAKDHHEFLDGTGYPRGLSGDSISVETCILSMTDVYDALTARDRPYKKATPPEKALDILSGMAENGKLHKELVDLFIKSRVWAPDSD